MKNRKKLRLEYFDYSQAGFYFVTICTKDRVCKFGDIKEGEMILNANGKIVDNCLNELEKHILYCELDYYCIMPNHIHVIIIINNTEHRDINESNMHTCSNEYPEHEIPNKGNLSVSQTQLQRDKQLLPVIIGSFKSAVSKLIHQNENDHVFKWQKSYYEHIIRNDRELLAIRKYIKNNPIKWKRDK